MKHLRQLILALSLVLFLMSNSSIEAQPWADCDTIRTYTISIDPFTDDDHPVNFQAAIDNVSSQSGIPIKNLGHTVITDPATINWFNSTDKVGIYLTGTNDEQLAGPLAEAIAMVNTTYYPDVLVLKTKAIPSNTTSLVIWNGLHPRRGWYMKPNSNDEFEVIVASHALVHLSGYINYDDTEANLMWPPSNPNNPNSLALNLTQTTIDSLNSQYQMTSITPNAIRDCGSITSVSELDEININYYSNRVELIDLKESMALQLVNSYGQVMLSKQLREGSQVVWFDEVKTGVYYLVIQSKSGIYSKGIFISRD